MSGPFHAIGMLRSNLKQTSYGQCSSPTSPTATPWNSAAVLDVIRGTTSGPKPSSPIVFPGNGATTSLTKFVAESPDPRTFCGWAGRSVGLPLIALMPTAPTSASAVLTGPNGPVGTCVLTGANTSGVASSILGGDNAVVVVPDTPLVTGTYTVAVSSNAGPANWSFNVDPNAPLVPNEAPPSSVAVLGAATAFDTTTPFRFADSRTGQAITRLAAGQQVRIPIAGQQGLPADMTAVSANFTIAEPTGDGYFTAFNCSGSQPEVSTLNFRAGEVIANQAVVPLDAGALCVYSYTDAHLIIDVNGYVAPSATSRFVPIDPKRLVDFAIDRTPRTWRRTAHRGGRRHESGAFRRHGGRAQPHRGRSARARAGSGPSRATPRSRASRTSTCDPAAFGPTPSSCRRRRTERCVSPRV